MTKDIRKLLDKAYVAVEYAKTVNKFRRDPDPDLESKLIIINELINECLERVNTAH